MSARCRAGDGAARPGTASLVEPTAFLADVDMSIAREEDFDAARAAG